MNKTGAVRARGRQAENRRVLRRKQGWALIVVPPALMMCGSH